MDDTLLQVASLWPWLSTGVAVLGGLWALGRVSQAPVVDRAERATAVWLAVGLAFLAGVGAMALAPTSNPVGGPIVLFLIIGIALAVAGFVFLSALLGYVVLARPRSGAVALVGIILGPLLLGGTTALAVAWRQDLQKASDRAAAADRAKGVHLSVEDLRVTTTTYPDSARGRDVAIVGAVHLTMAVHFDDSARRLRGSGIGLGVQVALRAPVAGVVLWADPTVWPTPLPAGPDARFPVAFTLHPESGLSAGEVQALSRSGAWSLELQFWEEAEGEYLVKVPVTIAVEAPS